MQQPLSERQSLRKHVVLLPDDGYAFRTAKVGLLQFQHLSV